MDSTECDVIVVGAGLVGLAIATFLARQHMQVEVVESYDDPRSSPANSLRSIGLTLSERGIRALDVLGVGASIGPALVPVVGRCVHSTDYGKEIQRYALLGDNAIYSVRRSVLVELMCEAAEAAGVKFRFRRRCIDLDASDKRVTVEHSSGAKSVLRYQGLFCADGARSECRGMLSRRYGVDSSLELLPQEFKEFTIGRKAARSLEHSCLHVWPRGEHLLIALPNVDGSFAATIFTATGGNALEGKMPSRELRNLLETRFADVLDLEPDCAQEICRNPVGRMATVRCGRWAYPGCALIVGDAAHAMPPFYGQGLNCALEGCQMLADMSVQWAGAWEKVFEQFERMRRPDVEAMWRLSHANHVDLSQKVAEQAYRKKRQIESILRRRFPEQFLPLYEMVVFSNLRYSEAYSRGMLQDVLVEQLASRYSDLADIERLPGGDWLDRLSLFPAGYRGRGAAWLPTIPSEGTALLGHRTGGE